MPRQRNLIPSTRIKFSLPEDTRARLDLHLWSDLEQRIPQGAYMAFLGERIREFFDSERLDIAPWTRGVDPGTFIVSGSPAAIAALRRALTGESS